MTIKNPNLVKIEGTVALVPYLSDSFYILLNDLVETSKKYPQSLAYPAGAIIISVACIESYINELIYMHSFAIDTIENEKIKKSFIKYDTDILKKLQELKFRAKRANIISDDLIDDIRLLISLRGRIVHYTVQEEYPNNKNLLSKLEKLEKRIIKDQKLNGIVSTERLLNPRTVTVFKLIVLEVIKCLYKSGYEPQRPRWVELIDPDRFNKGNK